MATESAEKFGIEMTALTRDLAEAGARSALRCSRITFKPSAIVLPGHPDAELIAPGHPLMDAIITEVLNRHGDTLTRGATSWTGPPPRPARG